MMKKGDKKAGLVSVLIILLLLPVFYGCGDDDDNDKAKITVCNLDDHAYEVEIRRDSDDVLKGRIHVEEWYDILDQCETKNNIDEGRYYLVIIDDDNDIVDESDDFYIEKGETLHFTIDRSGDIVEPFIYHDEAAVSVCNSQNNDYRVKLKRSSDDGLVSGFSLEQCTDFENLTAGLYYLETYKIIDNIRTDRSENFYLEPQQIINFSINPDGKLVNES